MSAHEEYLRRKSLLAGLKDAALSYLQAHRKNAPDQLAIIGPSGEWVSYHGKNGNKYRIRSSALLEWIYQGESEWMARK